MRNPIERIPGEIVDIKPSGEMTIKAKYENIDTLIRRNYKKVNIELIDSRPLSDKQRRMCWAMIREIAEWQGQSDTETARDLVNEARKVDFLVNEINENADRVFSLSNAPMSLVASYQRYLIHFILSNEIPTKKPLYEYADDISDYVYYCLITKKCAICGRPAQIHHIDRVGIGRDRHDIVHEGMECISLCAEHHDEIHGVGDDRYLERYHLQGIAIDKAICKKYKLRGESNE